MESFNIEDNKLIHYEGDSTEIFCPKVACLGEKAFSGNSIITAIHVPEGVQRIDDKCFECCYNLERIELPQSLISLGKAVFSNCVNLKKIVIPPKVITIPIAMCFACSRLEEVHLPQSITIIEAEAFSYCSLQDLKLPDGLLEIGDSAFFGCEKLTSVSLPHSLIKIGSYAFGSCKYLPTSRLNLSSSTQTDISSFDGCCKVGYQKTKILVVFSDDKHSINKVFEIELKDEERLSDVITTKICELLIDEFQEEIDNTLEQFYPEPQGVYSIKTIADELYSSASIFITNSYKDKIISISHLNSSDEIIDIFQVTLSDLLIESINERQACYAYFCDTGSIIDYSFQQFEKEGIWQYGFWTVNEHTIYPIENPQTLSIDELSKYLYDNAFEPIIWFAPPKVIPQSPWIVYPKMSNNDLKFWFEEDPYLFIQRLIVDWDDCFLTWYFYECGYSAPDIDSVREKCPISFSKETLSEEIASRLYGLFKGKFS